MSDKYDVAMITAHRACHSAEHDPLNGKIHGYCMVCGVPWPCEYANPNWLLQRAKQAETEERAQAIVDKRPRSIQIRFDGPPGPVAGRFVEVEDSKTGKSIRWGEWIQDGEYWLLRGMSSDPGNYIPQKEEAKSNEQ